MQKWLLCHMQPASLQTSLHNQQYGQELRCPVDIYARFRGPISGHSRSCPDCANA
ncbi:hypothetical protein DPMN_085915 [Dreissena polymorpha]|uniref:Uncharacterized protein n=1 Tax=Dreissena polymorpha TaxID=45954 RepID=A0A9D4BJU5_DREPO|nr:hypothetical protein DPMN_085915 [Dreissena polymorpha]